MELRRVVLLITAVLVHSLCFSAHASHVVYPKLQCIMPDLPNSELRTGYHFQPPGNWINDPNGPMYYNGIYHLFYQYNPKGSVWGNIVWAHSVSTDLINWKALQPAIYPSKQFDINGTWSGSATILPGNKPVIMYTGIDPKNRQVQNIAFPKNLSDPYLREWIKPDYNPVIDADEAVNTSAFRDPTTAWYHSRKRQWMLVVGSKWNTKGEALLYRSNDFLHWVKAKHPLHSSVTTGMWECPDFFPVALNGKHGLDTTFLKEDAKYALKVSLDLTRFEYYTLGKYDFAKDKYVPDNTSPDDSTGLRYDYGNFYASKTFYDPAKNRRILWGWVNESDTAEDDTTKGWAGVQTIPRTVWLHSNGRQLVQWPIEEVETLRGKQVTHKNVKVSKGHNFEIKGIDTSQADVEVTFHVGSLEKAEPFDPSWSAHDAQTLCGQRNAESSGGVGPFGLLVLASDNLRERTAVFFRVFKAETKHVVLMCHDPTRSTMRSNIYKPTFAGFVDSGIAETGKISLRSLIDNSVIESFGEGGKTCITSRVYPSLAIGEHAHMFLFNNGEAEVEVSELKAWEMEKPFMNVA